MRHQRVRGARSRRRPGLDPFQCGSSPACPCARASRTNSGRSSGATEGATQEEADEEKDDEEDGGQKAGEQSGEDPQGRKAPKPSGGRRGKTTKRTGK